MRCQRQTTIAAAAALLLTAGAPAVAQQFTAARVALLQAEDHRAATPAELARLRLAARGGDPPGVRLAVRALGRLERPAVIADILPALASRFTEIRAEAANAVAQAASGQRRGQSGGPSPASLLQTLRSRLAVEPDGGVRAALVEAIARLPYTDSDALSSVPPLLLEFAAERTEVGERLAVAKAFEAFVRLNKGVTLPPASLALLRSLAGLPAGGASAAADRRTEPVRDARVRRLALEALTTVGAMEPAIIEHSLADSDVQVRRLAVRAAARTRLQPVLTRALEDLSPMVRIEAVRGLGGQGGEDVCAWMLAATADPDPHVVLQAIDELRACDRWDQALTRLADLAADATAVSSVRGWHQASHALVALATAAPERAAAVLQLHATAVRPFVRVYAARAAALLKDRQTLDRLAADSNDNVVEAAVDALATLAGTDAEARYLAALERPGYQAVRAAARALAARGAASRKEPVVAALAAAHARLTNEGHDNSSDARTAITEALAALGSPLPRPPESARGVRRTVDPTLQELRRLAAPRARITMRGLGIIDVALITSEAPLTVVLMARLAESGYFNGLTIHRVVPNFVLQGGSPDANEYVGHPDHMRDEVGQWPHVRGALGISTRGRDTGDAQFFIDMVDNPRLDHEYTVFGQVIAGMDVAERVLEGDVIESVQILAK